MKSLFVLQHLLIFKITIMYTSKHADKTENGQMYSLVKNLHGYGQIPSYSFILILYVNKMQKNNSQICINSFFRDKVTVNQMYVSMEFHKLTNLVSYQISQLH